MPQSTKKTITIFISMPFHASFDRLYHDGIKPVGKHVESFFLNIIRLDEQVYYMPHIEENVLYHIDNSDILIADISRYPDSPTANVSVMHEIGYAAGRRTPVILIGGETEHKNLPTNLEGSIIVRYNPDTDRDYSKFSRELSKQIIATITDKVLSKVKGEFPVEGFVGRSGVHLDNMIEKARRRVLILTTNLTYTSVHLSGSIQTAIDKNRDNPDFKVEILTMDPESSVANERSVQLGRAARKYRDELRCSLEEMQKRFESERNIDIMTYTSLPTQMTFIIDNKVVVAVVSMSELSRESTHFLIGDSEKGVEPFVSHFRSVKTNRNRSWT